MTIRAGSPGRGVRSRVDRKVLGVMIPVGWGPAIGSMASLARIRKGCREMIRRGGTVISILVAGKA